MSRQLFSFLLLMTMTGLLALISRSVCIGMSHNIVISFFSDTAWGSCSYNLSFLLSLNFTDVPVRVCSGLIMCLCRYSVFAKSEHPATLWSMFFYCS